MARIFRPDRVEKIWWKVRKSKYKRGYSVHSPFVYNLITKVVREQAAYYCYEKIDTLLKELSTDYRKERNRLFCRKLFSVRKQIRYPRFLFRLVNYLHPRVILDIAPSAGEEALYMTLPYDDIHCTLIESEQVLAPLADRLLQSSDATRVTLQAGDWVTILDDYLHMHSSVDLIYCMLTPTIALEQLYAKCKGHLHSKSIFIVQGIRTNEQHRRAWDAVKCDPEVVVSIDMYSMGLLFYDCTLTPKDYTLYF